MNKPTTLCDRCDNAFHCLLNYDGKPCRKNRTVEPTNYDRLISKTPEELADFLAEIRGGLTCILGTEEGCPRPDTPCSECWLDWLRAPVGKEDKG